ncbi:MAG: response regulator transcription factor [Chloroflexales bacterium]|nr:response regulator transcription factor [Chloroflexales bacterium]
MAVVPIHILVVDDHAVVRSGLATFLSAYDDLELVGEAADGTEAIEQCVFVKPDVVLMDLVMPGMDGIEATRIIHEKFPHVQVIALTSFGQEDLVQAALSAGVTSYLLKNVTADDLAAAIRSAHAGHFTLSPEATEALIHAAMHPHTSLDNLTPREREVLTLMTRGLNNAEIAEQLVVSRSTVKFHVSSILSKMHATSRTEAVARAVQQHLVN